MSEHLGAEASPTGSASGGARGWMKRRRTSLMLGLALLAAVLIVVFTQGGVANPNPLDPQNPGLGGASQGFEHRLNFLNLSGRAAGNRLLTESLRE